MVHLSYYIYKYIYILSALTSNATALFTEKCLVCQACPNTDTLFCVLCTLLIGGVPLTP